MIKFEYRETRPFSMKFIKDRLFVLGLIIVFQLLISIVIYTSCKHETEVSTLRKVCFKTEVMPILLSNCISCHGDGAVGNLDLRTFEGMKNIIKAGDPYKSELYTSITKPFGDRMPQTPHSPLSIEERSTIFVWIKQGADTTSCSNSTFTCDTSQYSYSGTISKIMQTNCVSCHGASNPSYGLTLVSENDVKTIAANGLLEKVIFKLNNMPLMPPSGSVLSDCQKTQIKKWIKTIPPIVSPTGSDSICFTNDILPIFISNCTVSGCHNSINHVEGYNFSVYNSLMQGVVAGNANASIVYTTLFSNADNSMPPSPQNLLTAIQLTAIKNWINQGAKNSTCTSNCDTNTFTFSGAVNSIIQNSCTGCHSGSNPSFGLKLQTYSDIKTIADNGLLLQVLYQMNNKPLMPPSSALIDCKKTQIKKWIGSGSSNN
jgi:mono/diheme cytochrome c family protein